MAKTHPEVRLNRRPFSGIFEVVRVAADGKTITDRWPLSAEDQAWLARRSPAPQQVSTVEGAAPSDTDLTDDELSAIFNDRTLGAPIDRLRVIAQRASRLALTQPVQVEVSDEAVQVFWYEHDCEWLSKYCDEHHRRSALVPRSALGGGE